MYMYIYIYVCIYIHIYILYVCVDRDVHIHHECQTYIYIYCNHIHRCVSVCMSMCECTTSALNQNENRLRHSYHWRETSASRSQFENSGDLISSVSKLPARFNQQPTKIGALSRPGFIMLTKIVRFAPSVRASNPIMCWSCTRCIGVWHLKTPYPSNQLQQNNKIHPWCSTQTGSLASHVPV